MGGKWTAGVECAHARGVLVKELTDLGGLGALSTEEVQQVGETVMIARAMVRNTITRLASGTNIDKLRPFLNIYFKFDKWEDGPAKLREILAKLELTSNGINGAVNVKLRGTGGTMGFDVVGYVNQLTIADKKVIRTMSSNPRYTSFPRKDGGVTFKGDIHLRSDSDGPDSQLRTFIHEATHKYADTSDHDNRGYLEKNGTAGEKFNGLTKSQLINNADSYAWLCWKTWWGWKER